MCVWVSVLVSSFRDTESATLIGRPVRRVDAQTQSKRERVKPTSVDAPKTTKQLYWSPKRPFSHFSTFFSFALLKFYVKNLEKFLSIFFLLFFSVFYWKFITKIRKKLWWKFSRWKFVFWVLWHHLPKNGFWMPRHGGARALIGLELLRHDSSLLALVIQEISHY